MAKSRIVQLAGYGGPYAGSFVPMVRTVARMARQSGWEVECVFTPVARGRMWLDELAADGLEVRFAPGGGRSDVTRWLERRVAELDGPVILHTHFTAFDLPAVRAAAQREDVEAIWHVHTFLRTDPLGTGRNLLKYAWIGRKAASIICVSDTIAAGVRRRGGPRRKTTVLANGIDAGAFPIPNHDARRAARTRLGLPDEQPILLHFAWDWEVKGGPLFVELLKSLRARGLDAIGISVGGGKAAKEARESLGPNGALRVCDPTDDVRSLYAAADAFVACSAAEGTPFALLEALASGLAVVATEIPGHRLRADAPEALTLAPADPGDLADAASRVLARSRDDVGRDAREAHDWAREHFDLSRWGEELRRTYTQIFETIGVRESVGNDR